jgi:hypothetical protein
MEYEVFVPASKNKSGMNQGLKKTKKLLISLSLSSIM